MARLLRQHVLIVITALILLKIIDDILYFSLLVSKTKLLCKVKRQSAFYTHQVTIPALLLEVSSDTYHIMPVSKFSSLSDAHLSLCLEASADMCSAAIFTGKSCSAQATHHARHGHAETLIGLVEQACAEADISLTQLDTVIAGCGPGSFTGLRVCLAAAQGYRLAAQALGVGISTLSALAFHARDTLQNSSGIRTENDRIISFCDTRRKSFFVQIFDCNLQIQTEILDIKATDFPAFIAQEKKAAQSAEMILSGDVAILDESMVLNHLTEHSLTINAVKIEAELLGKLCCEASLHHLFLPLEPLYVHPAIISRPAQK